MPASANDTASLSDEDLLERTAEGDAKASAALYDRHSPYLYGLALRILRNQTAAEDALIRTWSALWDEARYFRRDRDGALPWITMLCRNCSIAVLRPDHAAGERNFFLRTDTPIPTTPWREAGPRALRDLVRQALRRLPEERREAIELAYYEGLDQSEISNRLQMPVGAIRTRIRLGMRKLREVNHRRGRVAPDEGPRPIAEDMEQMYAAYALDALGRREQERIEAHIRSADEVVRREIAELRHVVELLGLNSDPVAPRPDVKDALGRRLALRQGRSPDPQAVSDTGHGASVLAADSAGRALALGLRASAGETFPSADEPDATEVHVRSGHVRIGDAIFAPGTFALVAGLPCASIRADDECSLVIVYRR